MEHNDKDELRARLMKTVGKEPTFEEKKRLRERARQKHAERRRDRPRARVFDEDAEAFEGLRRVGLRGVDPAPRSLPVDDTLSGEEALVLGIARTRVRVRAGVSELDALAPAGEGEIAVGDVVVLERRSADLALVRALRPRRTRLVRPDPHVPGRERVLAANVDVAVLVVSAAEPPLKPAFIDRLLIAVEVGGLAPLLCVNKMDLVQSEPERRAVEAAVEPYRCSEGLGVPVVLCSARNGGGMAELMVHLEGKRCVVIGHSGVGKSSLLNAIDPDGSRSTGAVRASDGRGRHTTSSSSLREIRPGTELIDTPGVRQFGIAGITPATLAFYFPDFAQAARRCHFRDCSHLVEPGCGVRSAAESGAIAPRRIAIYTRIRAELADG